MGESTWSSSFYNPTLSANKHVQIFRFFAIGCRRSCRRFTWASNLAFQRRRTKLKRHWKIAESCCSPTVSARLRYHGSNSVVFVHRAGTLVKHYPLSKLFSKAEMLSFELEKFINLVCSSCLKHANEMLLGDPRQVDQRTQSFNFSIAIHQYLDPTAQAPRSLSLHACMNQSATFLFLHQWVHSSTWVSSHSALSQAQNATHRRVVELLCMTTRDLSLISIDVTSVSLSLSLSTHEKSLTHCRPFA